MTKKTLILFGLIFIQICCIGQNEIKYITKIDSIIEDTFKINLQYADLEISFISNNKFFLHKGDTIYYLKLNSHGKPLFEKAYDYPIPTKQYEKKDGIYYYQYNEKGLIDKIKCYRINSNEAYLEIEYNYYNRIDSLIRKESFSYKKIDFDHWKLYDSYLSLNDFSKDNMTMYWKGFGSHLELMGEGCSNFITKNKYSNITFTTYQANQQQDSVILNKTKYVYNYTYIQDTILKIDTTYYNDSKCTAKFQIISKNDIVKKVIENYNTIKYSDNIEEKIHERIYLPLFLGQRL